MGTWCKGCQRGNSYNDNGECVDCGLEIATPYKQEEAIKEGIKDAAVGNVAPLDIEALEVVKPKKKYKYKSKKVLSNT